MRRLYLRIYVAVLLSLAAFALTAGVLWRHLADGGAPGRLADLGAALAADALPPADAPAAEQQAGLERLVARTRAEVSLFAADRRLLAAVGQPLPAPDVARAPALWRRRGGGGPAWSIQLADGRWLVARLPREHRPPGYGLFLTLAVVALAVGVGAYPVVRRLTSRLERLQAGVESLGAGDLSARVKVEGHDEVARLALSFNRAARRIEDLVGAHRALLANASHELRTPLARIRMAVELLKADADPARRRELEQDVAELDALLDEILLSSRLDAVGGLEPPEEVDLLALATEEVARYGAIEIDGEPVSVQGDPRLLRRMLRNLLDNARRHGAPPIEVRVRRAGTGAEIRVCDGGPGVPEGERERVFQPFYRFAHAGDSTGAGLGLALVRQIARRHGGDASCLDHEPRGTCFAVTLGRGAQGARMKSSAG